MSCDIERRMCSGKKRSMEGGNENAIVAFALCDSMSG
jgi:hypothetical protein